MASETDVSQLSFEDALKELEGIVEQLERGDVALEESIKIYERGAALKLHCQNKLQNAKLKIEQIVLKQNGDVETTAADVEA